MFFVACNNDLCPEKKKCGRFNYWTRLKEIGNFEKYCRKENDFEMFFPLKEAIQNDSAKRRAT